MKKQFFSSLCITLVLFMFLGRSFAQSGYSLDNNSIALQRAINTFKTDIDNSNVHKVPASLINAKVLRGFLTNFKSINDPTWLAMGKNYLAEFDLDDMASRAFFDKNGYLYYTLSTGTEKNLPADTRRFIKSRYVDYNLSSVTKVNSDGKTAWFVNIEDKDNLIVVRVIDDSIDELEHYQTHFTLNKKGKIIKSPFQF